MTSDAVRDVTGGHVAVETARNVQSGNRDGANCPKRDERKPRRWKPSKTRKAETAQFRQLAKVGIKTTTKTTIGIVTNELVKTQTTN